MNSIQFEQQQIIETFSLFDDWMDKYTILIAYAKELERMPDNLKTDETLIKECQSNLWVSIERRGDQIFIKADSEVLIVKGIAALLIRLLSGKTAEEIRDTNLNLFKEIGLEEHITQTRANGLNALIQRIYSLCNSVN